MRQALAFLTPFGGARRPDSRTLSWFPVAGVLIGATLGGLWWLAGHAWSPLVAAALFVAGDLALTGMLHLDGLVDSADGLIAHLPRDVRLKVMSEPTVGAFGVAAAVTILLLRFVAVASLVPDVALIAALWCASRTVMAVAARTVPYARHQGIATAFEGGPPLPTAVIGWVLAAGLGLYSGWPGFVAVVAAVVAGSGVVLFGRARLGGYTGDVLGAAGVIAETVGLLVAAARW